MAIAVKFDLESLSDITRGSELFGPTAAHRGFEVTGMVNATPRARLKEALDFVDANHSTAPDDTRQHPDYLVLNDLPVAHIRGYHFGNTVRGVVTYKRSAFSTPRRPAFEAAVEKTFEAGFRTITTMPGAGYKALDGVTVYPTFHRETVQNVRNQIRVRTTLDENPRIHMESKIPGGYGNIRSAINEFPFKIGGVMRPANTLRFDGVHITPFDTPTRTRYAVEYTLLEDTFTWLDDILLIRHMRCPGSTFAPSDFQSATAPPMCNGEFGDNGSLLAMYQLFTIGGAITYTAATGSSIELSASISIIDFDALFPTHDAPNGVKNDGTPAP